MMGYLYIEWGQYEKAEGYLTEALETIQSAYLTRHAEAAYGKFTVTCNDQLCSPHHSVVNTVLSQLGRCYCSQGRLTESEEYHRHALKVTKYLFGDDHHRTAKGFICCDNETK